MRGEKTVNISAIKNNLNSVKSKTGVKVICVVKANAYGHGAYKIAKELDNEDGYAVATVDEALEVKEAVKGKREVLLLGKVFKEDYETCVKNRITMTVDNEEELSAIERAAYRMNTFASVHIAINTGMNRIGIKYDKPLYKLINYAKTLKRVRLKGVYSHLYSVNEEISRLQRERFISAINKCDVDKSVLLHLGATSSINRPDFHFDMIRLGLGLYGYGGENLTPAMSVYGRVSAINFLSPGETVGYGGAHTATKPEIVATLSLGYADGIPRSYSGGEVIIGGKRRKIVGNICMDACFAVVDDSVRVGDKVVFLGEEKGEKITAEDMAKTLGTIPYEILTGFKRIKTAYLG